MKDSVKKKEMGENGIDRDNEEKETKAKGKMRQRRDCNENGKKKRYRRNTLSIKKGLTVGT